MKFRWRNRRYIVVVVALLTMIAPFLLCTAFLGFNSLFKYVIPHYPNAREVDSAYGLYGASSGQVVEYYWTTDSIESVRAFYQPMTLPFQIHPSGPYEVTAFSATNRDLSYVDIMGQSHEVGNGSSIYCHYTLTHNCVNVFLRALSENDIVNLLPNIIGIPKSSSDNRTPAPLPVPLSGGTLIIYSYYVNDF